MTWNAVELYENPGMTHTLSNFFKLNTGKRHASEKGSYTKA